MNWEEHKEEILRLKSEGLGSGKIAEHLRKMGLDIPPSSDRHIRRKIKKWLNPKNTFEENLDEQNFNFPEKWSYGWFKGDNASIFIRNQEGDVSLEELTDSIKEAVGNFKPSDVKTHHKGNKKALRMVISDAHVGMDSNIEDAMFGFEYNEKIWKKNLGVVLSHVKSEIEKHGAFDRIIVDDLGDGLDGFNQETTRGGHKLPQNMTDMQSWKAYVTGKLETILNIISLDGAEVYEFRNVANCNHAGTWGWTANMAIKMTLEQIYPNVEYHVLTKPMEHFTYGKHTHILTHGKDKSLMIKNWPFNLTDKVANIIRQYIDHHDIKTPYVHLDKGDLHKIGYDREPKFDYTNFMSFAPPSAWVQANFGVSYCGFSKQIIPRDSNEVEHTNIFFELKKV